MSLSEPGHFRWLYRTTVVIFLLVSLSTKLYQSQVGLYRSQRGNVAIQPRLPYLLFVLGLVVRALKLVRLTWRGPGMRVGR